MKENKLNLPATPEMIVELLRGIRDSFAERKEGFYSIMADMIIKNKFTEIQLRRGLNSVKETCPYNQLSIAAVIQACKGQPDQRLVEYRILNPSGNKETVIFMEREYLLHLERYQGTDYEPEFIRYIEE